MSERARPHALSEHSETFLKELERLAREATLLKNDAIVIGDRIGTPLLDAMVSRLSGDNGTLRVVTGAQTSSNDGQKRRGQAELLWNCLRVSVARTNGAFALDDPKTISQILTEGRDNVESSFWRFHEQDDSGIFPYARVYFLVSLYSALLSRVDSHSAIGKSLEGGFRGLVTDAKRLLFNVPLPSNAQALWQLAIAKLAATALLAEQTAGQPLEVLLDEGTMLDRERQLQQSVALAVLPGSASKPATESADVLSVLCGRLLNPKQQVAPAQMALFGAAADQILNSLSVATVNSDREKVHADPDHETGDPLGHGVPALSYVLDLPNSLLTDRMATLARVAKLEVDRYRRELDMLLVAIPERSAKVPAAVGVDLDAMQVFSLIYGALVIGTAVSERLRDLLSELELQRLDTTTPANVVAWEDLSDSLGFMAELDYVIDLWRTRSKSRPGAILVFGPPGTGKTTIAEAFLRRLNENLMKLPGAGPDHAWQFLQLSPADFARRGADKVIASAEGLFKRLQRLRRCVVLLDEMEEFLRSRGTDDTDRDGRLVTTAFLPLLQETVDRREIILIVATNYVGGIDSAITRRGRFDLILPLGPPNRRSRARIISNALGGPIEQKGDGGADMWRLPNQERTTLTPLQMMSIVEYTQGYTFGEILDFLKELTNTVTAVSLGGLTLTLWRIRQEKVPLALSGNPGCDWRRFQDEATRFRRVMRPAQQAASARDDSPGRRGADKTLVDSERDPERYWDDPPLPVR